MQFVADENIDDPIIAALRELKIDVLSISELMPGCSDSEVLSCANKNNSFLITSDKDFGEIIFRQQKIIKGVILLRLHGLSNDKKIKIVKNFFVNHLNSLSEANTFVVITENNIRIRKSIG
jgi:predicted nuclease of predicted toxin-antitoxin system